MPSNKETGSQLIESEKWDKPVVVIAGTIGIGKDYSRCLSIQ